MELKDFFARFSSDTTAGSANQRLCFLPEYETRTGRVWYKLRSGGENYALLFSNIIDSTFADGSESRANMTGEPWEILKVTLGICEGPKKTPEKTAAVTFGGCERRFVMGKDTFCSDPVYIGAKKGDWLCYEITFRGKTFPQQYERAISSSVVTDGEERDGQSFPFPLTVANDRRTLRRIAFIGDSITQGLGTPTDAYMHYVGQIADRLPDPYSVWDLGIGYARGYDAATDRFWLERAKTCDTVNVCFGVNDISRGRTDKEVIADLEKILKALKKAHCRTVLFTVPAFDFTGKKEEYFRSVNRAIREGKVGFADAVFDFSECVAKPAPRDNEAAYGGHPNADGCKAVAEAYVKSGIIDRIYLAR